MFRLLPILLTIASYSFAGSIDCSLYLLAPRESQIGSKVHVKMEASDLVQGSRFDDVSEFDGIFLGKTYSSELNSNIMYFYNEKSRSVVWGAADDVNWEETVPGPKAFVVHKQVENTCATFSTYNCIDFLVKTQDVLVRDLDWSKEARLAFLKTAAEELTSTGEGAEYQTKKIVSYLKRLGIGGRTTSDASELKTHLSGGLPAIFMVPVRDTGLEVELWNNGQKNLLSGNELQPSSFSGETVHAVLSLGYFTIRKPGYIESYYIIADSALGRITLWNADKVDHNLYARPILVGKNSNNKAENRSILNSFLKKLGIK